MIEKGLVGGNEKVFKKLVGGNKKVFKKFEEVQEI